MKMNIGKFKGKAVIVASFVVLFLCAVLACTVYAVTLDMEFDSPISASVGEDRTVGDGTRSFSWTIDTSAAGADSIFKPVTAITGKLGGAVANTQTVTTSGYNGSLNYAGEGDEVVTVTVGGDTSGGSAFYNTNLVYTLTNPTGSTQYAKFRIFQDEIIPVDCTQTELDDYVSNLTVSSVVDTYDVCETLTFDLAVPENGMKVTFTPMVSYIPVEVHQQITDEDGNKLRDADSSLTTKLTRYQYNGSTSYTQDKYFYGGSDDDYYASLISSSTEYPSEFTASGAVTKFWIAKGYDGYYGLNAYPTASTGFNANTSNALGFTSEVKTRTGVTVTGTYSSGGFGPKYDQVGPRIYTPGWVWMEYGADDTWISDYIAADKIVITVNYTQNSQYVPVVEPGSTYSVTVNSTYEDAVNNDDCRQYIEIYDDTTKNPVARVLNQAAATLPAENTTPAINVKSNNKVRVKSVQVLDANGDDITQSAFGSQARYDYFIESTKTSLFGYFELYNVTGNITVNVTYDEPVADLGNNYYSMTVVTKGDVGPYNHVYANDARKTASVMFSSTTYSNYTDGTYNSDDNFALDLTHASGKGNSDFTYGNYNVSGQYSKFIPSDGGQTTRYCYQDRTVTFDNTNYSYIADLKAYYNDTGEDTGWDLSGLIGQKVSYNQSFTYNRSQNNTRSVTFVVTYKELPTTTVFTRLNNHVSGISYYGTLSASCPNGNALINGSNNNYYTAYNRINDIYASYNPLQKSQYSYNQFAVVDSDTVRISAQNSYKTKNSVDFSKIKVYALDVDNATYGEEITDKLSITYSPARTAWGDDGYVDISGLKEYGGNIYVEGDTLHYNTPVRIQSNGTHTDSFTITADALGAIGATNDDADMQSSYTVASNVSYADRYMYSGGTYTIKSDGSQSIDKVEFNYYSNETGSVKSKKLTFDTIEDDGSIKVTLPTDEYYTGTGSYASYNKLTVYYTPIYTLEAQIYATSGNALISSAYSSLPLVEVTAYDNADNGANVIFNTNSSGVSTAYQSVQVGQSTSLSNANYIYTVLPGAKIKVKNVFVGESRNIDSGIKDFINRRLELKDIKVYKANRFLHNSAGDAIVDDEIEVTREGEYYVFTMPVDSGVRIAPMYEDHIRTVNILANDPENSNSKYRIDQSTRGTATLAADEGSYFINSTWATSSAFNSSYHIDYFFKQDWRNYRYNTLDGSSFTLTVTPVTEDDVPLYKVKSVKAYKYDTNSSSSNAQYNHINTSVGSGSTFNWLTFNGSGEVTNTEIPNVVGELTVTDETTGKTQCTITLPSTLDVGNIVLYIEFEENVKKYAPLAYVNGSGTSTFRPRTVFSGDIQDYTTGQVDATNGMDVNAAFYKAEEASPKEITMTIGGDNSENSAFYHTNLVYTVKSYDEDTTYGTFRIFEGQLKDVTGTAGNVIVADSFAYTPRSETEYATAAATLKIRVPEGGLKITGQSEVTYIPVTFKQKILQSDGTVTDAGNTFTATVTKYNSGFNGDTAREKYFTKEFTQDYYSLINKEAETYFDATSFTVTGAQEKRNMAIPVGTTISYYYDVGYYVLPSVPEGYMLAGIKARSLSSKGDTFGNNSYYDGYYNRENSATSLEYYTNPNGYLFTYMRNGMTRGNEHVVEIYYAPVTKVTVQQHVSGISASGGTEYAYVKLSNTGTLSNTALTPYVDNYSNHFINDVTFSAKGNNYTGSNVTDYDWVKSVSVNQDTHVRFLVRPQGTRNVGSVRVYKIVNGEEVDLEYTVVSGTGYVNSDTVYEITDDISYGDDVHIDVIYGNEQTLTVQAVMLDSSNSEQTNNAVVTNYEVKVTGLRYNNSGEKVSAFKNEGVSDYTFSQFTTGTSKTVSVYSSTELTIDTSLIEGAQSSDYVVANVKLFEGSSTTPVSSVSPHIIRDENGKEIGKDYSHCTIDSLSPNVNTTIKVYFAKTAKLKVSVYTIGTDGKVHEGVPWNGNVGNTATGSYINVRGSSGLNSNTFVTRSDEGNYTTGDFQFTYNPYFKEVNVLQGTNISVFSFLPNNDDWVVKKIVGTDNFSSKSVSDVSVIDGDNGVSYLRSTISTSNSIYPDRGDYELEVYIAKAKTISVKTITNMNDQISSPNGTVRVCSRDLENGVIPFTKMYPIVDEINSTWYNATSTSSGGTYPYTTKTKCVTGTKIYLQITPSTNFFVKTLQIKQGNTPLSYTQDGNNYYITPLSGDDDAYTMPDLADLDILVEFASANYSRVYVDYQVAERGNQLTSLEDYFGLHGDGYISATNYNEAYKGLPLMKQIVGGDWRDPAAGTAGDLAGNSFSFDQVIGDEAEHSNYFKFDVIMGSTVTIKTHTKDNKWLSAVEFWVTDKDENVISKGTTNDVYTKFSGITMQNEGPYTFHARFVENSRVLFRTVDLNCYDNVRQDGEHVAKDSEFGGLSSASREGDYYNIEDVELTDMYEEHMMTATSKFNEKTSGYVNNYIQGSNDNSETATKGPLGFEGDRESKGRSGIDDYYYPNPMGYDFDSYSGTAYSAWNWQSSRDCTALNGTSLTNLKVDTSKMRTPWNTPVAGNGSVTTQNRNQSETSNYPSGWDVVAKIYKFDKNQSQLTGVVEHISPNDLNTAVYNNNAEIVAEIDITRDKYRLYKNYKDYQLAHSYQGGALDTETYIGHDNYNENLDYMSHDMELKLDPQYYYMVVVKYEQIHVYTKCNSDSINTYFATMHYHSDNTSPYSSDAGLKHDHDVVNDKDIEEMFINSKGSTNGKLLDTRIPLYYGRPGDNHIPGRDSAMTSPDNIYNSWYKQTYFVMVSDTPKEELSITDVTFYDYRSRLTAVVDASDPIVISETDTDYPPEYSCWANASGSPIDSPSDRVYYRTIVNSSGFKRYQYIIPMYLLQTYNPKTQQYENTFGDTVLDNTLRIDIHTREIKPDDDDDDDDDDPVNTTAIMNVAQYDRTSPGNYILSKKDTSTVQCVTTGGTIKLLGEGNEPQNMISIPDDTGEATATIVTQQYNTFRLEAIPQQGYVLEKIVINGKGNRTLYPKDCVKDANGNYTNIFEFSGSNAENIDVKLYYAHPILRVTVNNTASEPKGSVDAYDTGTEEENKVRILESNEYTKDTDVGKGDRKTLKIIPEQYSVVENNETIYKKYTVEYISVGDAYDTLIPVYDASKEDPNLSEDYVVTYDLKTGNYYVSLKEIAVDTYVFIQLRGETVTHYTNVEVRHHIKLSNSDSYVNCDSDNPGGTVVVNGVLSGVNNPLLNDSGEECASITLGKNEYSASGAIQQGTRMYLAVAPPKYYKVDMVESKYGTSLYPAGVHQGDDAYAGMYDVGYDAPESGIVYLDVYYSLNLTDYKLIYKYSSRFQNNGDDNYQEGNTPESQAELDREYVKNVSLPDTYLDKDGKPIDSVLVNNAPAIDDLYKNCVWTIDSDHVVYDTENHTVTVTAVQPSRLYSVEFVYDNKTQNVTQVPLNSLVTVNEEFITAPETDGVNPFAYWTVVKDGKEVAKCFDREFDLRITCDCTVTACYSAVAKAVTISDALYTREQTTDEDGKVTDRLYADFILAYMEKDGKLLNQKYDNATTDSYKTGLIMEYDNNIKLKKEDIPGATLQDDEKVVYEEGDKLSPENAKKLVEGKALENPDHSYRVYAVSNDKYNNHNRVDKAILFNNTENVRHLVFRAYYYVWNETTGIFEMTDPVYFYMYDIGNSVVNTAQ